MAKKLKSKSETPPPTKDLKKSDKSDTKTKTRGKPGPVESADDEKKKPQRGLDIGGNFGWTGKLPSTLLHELCQKQKWGKVVFDMRKNSKGFTGVVNLTWENPKTKQMVRIQMIPDSETYTPKETTNEARHFAATYALHRINFSKNMKMLFPTIFRDYWTDMEAARTQLLKLNKELHDRKFNANPFLAHLEEVKRKDQKEKERLLKQQNEEKVKKPTISIGIKPATKPGHKPSAPVSFNGNVAKEAAAITTFPRKVWENAPFIDFDSEIRTSIESSVRNHINWVFEHEDLLESKDNKACLQSLLKAGFREPHIKEAFKYTSTYIDALEWLLFHIPEDDLPPFFAKTDKDSSVSLKISKNIQIEYLMKRMAQSGFDTDDIVTALEATNYDEVEASVHLINQLMDKQECEAEPDSQQIWEEEIDALKMIGSNKIEFVDGSNNKIVNIALNATNVENGLLSLRLFKSTNYPSQLPGIHLLVNDVSFKLANYIKMSIIKQAVAQIVNEGHLGACFIFTIIDWMENNIHKVIQNPGSLLDERLPIHSKVPKQDSFKQIQRSKISKSQPRLTQEDLENIEQNYKKRLASSELQSMVKKRTTLPAWKKRDELISMIDANRVTLVTGETGSGKSTQIVQFILDHLNSNGKFGTKIMCTQPRRISTIGLAERISDERADKLGNETGYVIRGENKTNKTTRLSFVTTGVLLRMLQSMMSSKGKDDLFESLEYIFVDEVHERSVDSDFLLIILKNIMKKHSKLKIILMSATINIDTFKKFFDTPLNHIHIEGRTFPIEDYYLDTILDDTDYRISTNDEDNVKPRADSHFFKSGNFNYNLIAKLCQHVDEKLQREQNDGSILIFLPGIMEINQCIREINNVLSNKCWPLPLHSALLSNDQKKVFKRSPNGERKIVVSTNIAETSITIPDCVVVIDSGRSKSVFYDKQLNTTKLIESWCSKAEMNQRRGRSGRITNGNCYHLYTKETQEETLSQPVPEIKRTRLENLYLIVKAMGISNVEKFLSGGIDAPDMHALSKSKQFLQAIGALNNDHLSSLGKYLSLLPTDLQSGKLLILGCIFGCLDNCLSLAAISSTGSPFLNSYDLRDKIREVQAAFSNDQGDLICMANAVREYENVRRERQNSKKFISNNYLSYTTLTDIASTKSQYISLLQEIGFVPLGYKHGNDVHTKLNRNNENFAVLRAIITGSFYPQIARVQLPDTKFVKSTSGTIAVDPDAKKTKFWIRNENFVESVAKGQSSSSEELPATRAFVHPSSVVFDNRDMGDTPDSNDYVNEDGTIDMARARQEFDLTPKVIANKNTIFKSSFVVYRNSNHTTKLFLRDITPTTTLATLLFGGEILYNLSDSVIQGRTSPGIVLDNWMPIKTWCKNAVLIKRLRKLLDALIDNKLSMPNHLDLNSNHDVLEIIEKILEIT
jgi:HrpA-like RNA helicase